jgi:GTP-binding protein Era
VTVESYVERDGGHLIDIDAEIVCEKDSHKGMIIGKGGKMLKKIGSAARVRIEEFLACHVNLQLRVKVRQDWRNNERQLDQYGY